jgi:hypothetical protein
VHTWARAESSPVERVLQGSVMVQRFLHDVQQQQQQQQQQAKAGQQQGPRPRVSIAQDGPTSTLDSFAQTTYSNEVCSWSICRATFHVKHAQ